MSEEKSKKRISTSSITTVISVSLVLFLLGLLGVFLISAKKISEHLKENISFHVYLKDKATDDETERLHNFLNACSYVKSSVYLSKDSAALLYKKDVGEDFVKFIGYNPLPASMEVQLKADYANRDSIAWIQKQITDFSSVKEFNYQESLVNLVNKNVNRIALVLLIFITLLLVIALALINNTIRLAIYSKRFLIKTMQLVGATGNFIRKPFLVNGIKHGMISGIIANLMLWGIIFTAVKKIPDLEQVTDMRLMIFLFGVIFILGIFISGVSTFLSVRKYLRLSSEELYY
ncbi:MAG: cell division protein FtsX [Bacteroidetes bacterium]|nr:cell division protein FtsX [Bacteroidota bacterium]